MLKWSIIAAALESSVSENDNDALELSWGPGFGCTSPEVISKRDNTQVLLNRTMSENFKLNIWLKAALIPNLTFISGQQIRNRGTL